jgi:hypothetical protein
VARGLTADAAGELERLIASGAGGECVRFFSKLDEKQRRELRPVARQHFRRLRGSRPHSRPGVEGWGSLEVARLAVLATATLSQIRQRQLFPEDRLLGFFDVGPDALEIQVLRERRPAWLGKWAEWLCERRLLQYWPAIYALERDGLCARPAGDGWVLGFLERLGPGSDEILAALERDPGLVEGPLWRLFEVVRTDRADAHKRAWRTVLQTLVRRGVVPRTRVLDATLDALERDFHPLQARWFRQLHDELAPRPDELAERAVRYAGLISSRVPGTAKIGLAAVETLTSKVPWPRPLRPAELLENLRPTLSAKTQEAALRGLDLLERIGEGRPRLAARVAHVALDTLLHASPGVQKRGLEFFERWGDPRADDVRDRLAGLARSAAPVHRRRLAEFLAASGAEAGGEALAPGTLPDLGTLEARCSRLDSRSRELAGIDAALAAAREERRCETASSRFDAAPRLDPANRLAPVAHLDELIELAHRIFEGTGAPDDLNLLADGISRLGRERPADFARRTAPLRQRLVGDGEELALWEMWQAQIELGGLILCWLEPRLFKREIQPQLEHDLEPRSFESTVEGLTYEVGPDAASLVLVRLAFEIADRLAGGRAAPLVSFPTHRGGWLDPRSLAGRLRGLAGRGIPAGVVDTTLALLRLAPEHRQAALDELAGLPGEPAAAARHALGGAEAEIGPTETLWLAAARVRHPTDGDEAVARRFPRAGPGTAHAHRTTYHLAAGERPYPRGHLRMTARHEPPLPGPPPGDLVTVRYITVDPGREPWIATLWPAAKDPLYLAAANMVLSTPKGLFWGCRAHVDPLLDPDEPIGDAGLRFTAIALGRQVVETATLAEEIVLAAFGDGRLTGRDLGTVLGELLPEPSISPNRWVAALARIAEESVLHRTEVKATLETVVAAVAAGDARRRLLAALELLHGLAVDSGEPLRDPRCVERLRAWAERGAKARRRSKSAQLAHELASFAGRDTGRLDAAIGRQQLAARLDRAERWQRRAAGDDSTPAPGD